MNNELRNVAENMRELGLGALTHANRHAAYQDIVNDKWAELSVLQAAHAAEILIKAKIAEEHPLLIFEKFPKITDDNLSLLSLFEDGHTIEWSQLPNRLWATTSMHLPNKDVFIRFGKLRNSIQHFGAIPKDVNASLETLRFIYSVIDPFIYECWQLYAILMRIMILMKIFRQYLSIEKLNFWFHQERLNITNFGIVIYKRRMIRID